LLEKGPFFREQREHARKISHGIQGFGSFNENRASSNPENASNFYGRSISLYEECSCNGNDQKENLNLGSNAKGNRSASEEGSARDEGSKDFAAGEREPFIAQEGAKKNDELETIVNHPFEKESKECLLLLSQG
jgi:hypothetical protein